MVAELPRQAYSPECVELDFSHLGAPQSASANGSINALRLSSGRCARATRKKSLRPSKSAPASFSPHEEEVERSRAQRTPGKVELQASESGPFRSPASSLAKSGAAGRRRLKLSLHFELMADGCPLPLSPKWLKSSVERLSGNLAEGS
jgi:hypothetical protein